MNYMIQSILVEFEYCYSALYSDFKGRVCYNLREHFQDVYPRDDHNKVIRIFSEDASLVTRITPTKSGVLYDLAELEESQSKTADEHVEYYSELVKVVYKEVVSQFKIEGNIGNIRVEFGFLVDFEDKNLLKEFIEKFIITDKMGQVAKIPVTGFDCTYYLKRDNGENSIKLNMEEEVVKATVSINFSDEKIECNLKKLVLESFESSIRQLREIISLM